MKNVKRTPCLTMLKKDRTLFFNQSLQRDPHQQLMGSILGLDPSSIYCAILLTKQTNQQTKGHGWKHNLLGKWSHQ